MRDRLAPAPVRFFRALVLASAAVALCACVGSQAIRPVGASGVSLVCIQLNPEEPDPRFVAELRAQMLARGLRSLTYEGSAPAECRYRMLYWTRRESDLAPYLAFAALEVYDRDVLVGKTSYDAWARGLGLQKYHPTAGKIATLLDQLFPSTRRD